MTITLQAVNELIQSLESAGELSIKEQKYLELAKSYAVKEEESMAQALTFEKCRELSGCPASVDLQDHLRQLAAENVGLKAANNLALNILNDEETMVTSLWASSVQHVEATTPATDRIYAGIKADGVEEFAKHCDDSIGFVEPEDEELYTLMEEQAREFAQQLREGATNDPRD
ncbi:TPA: hypothetical protein MHQ02_02610 [Klebsiella pneumoniae subsp. pneumoniae]|nr:hypothetical protein [Klebsiella pneumoniae subsp. pneumoniae]